MNFKLLALFAILAIMAAGCNTLAITGAFVQVPENEPVNNIVASEACSQIDDGNYCTDDICKDGVASHVPNNKQAEALTICPKDVCRGGYRIDYPKSGYAKCVEGKLVAYNCTATRKVDAACEKLQTPPAVIPPPIKKSYGGGGGGGSSVSVVQPDPVGVPEFSTLTLGMAVIGGCLGLVLIRKRQ